jgi:hypothetical protein
LLKHPYDEQHVRFHFISDKVNLMPDFAASTSFGERGGNSTGYGVEAV